MLYDPALTHLTDKLCYSRPYARNLLLQARLRSRIVDAGTVIECKRHRDDASRDRFTIGKLCL